MPSPTLRPSWPPATPPMHSEMGYVGELAITTVAVTEAALPQVRPEKAVCIADRMTGAGRPFKNGLPAQPDSAQDALAA